MNVYSDFAVPAFGRHVTVRRERKKKVRKKNMKGKKDGRKWNKVGIRRKEEGSKKGKNVRKERKGLKKKCAHGGGKFERFIHGPKNQEFHLK
jgi:hypothetical protein